MIQVENDGNFVFVCDDSGHGHQIRNFRVRNGFFGGLNPTRRVFFFGGFDDRLVDFEVHGVKRADRKALFESGVNESFSGNKRFFQYANPLKLILSYIYSFVLRGIFVERVPVVEEA